MFNSTFFKIVKLVAFGVVPFIFDAIKDNAVDKGTAFINSKINK